MNLLRDNLLGHGGVDDAIRAIRAILVIYGTPGCGGNPYHMLRRHVDSGPNGKRIADRLTTLGNQWSERERAREDSEALARKYQ